MKKYAIPESNFDRINDIKRVGALIIEPDTNTIGIIRTISFEAYQVNDFFWANQYLVTVFHRKAFYLDLKKFLADYKSIAKDTIKGVMNNEQIYQAFSDVYKKTQKTIREYDQFKIQKKESESNEL